MTELRDKAVFRRKIFNGRSLDGAMGIAWTKQHWVIRRQPFLAVPNRGAASETGVLKYFPLRDQCRDYVDIAPRKLSGLTAAAAPI